jgi:outer membrane protein assembly factor BamD
MACAPKSEKGITLSKEAMYTKAEKKLLKNEFILAANDFEMLDETFPFTVEGNKSVIMASYAYYKGKNYDESLRLIEYFKKINFDNYNLKYMYFLEILNNIGKIGTNTRNVDLIENTIALADNFSRHFPDDNIYIYYIMEQKDILQELYAKRELEIVDFYLFNNNLLGALSHLRTLEEKYSGYKYIYEINYKLFEIYRHINYEQGKNYYFSLLEQDKNTKWYKYAKNRI